MRDRTVVVLGASGEENLGSCIARRIAREGANVVVSARRAEPLERLAAEIGGLAVSCDATREPDIAALFATAKGRYGRVDAAVYSVGIHAAGAIATLDAEAIRPTLELSFIGALLFFKHAAAAMAQGGSVVTISSMTARIPGEGYSVYSGARAGIDYAIRVAALEYASRRIRFNSIAPGLIRTDMTAPLFAMDAIVAAHEREAPVGRMGRVEDVAEAALFLLDDARSGYVNGKVLDLCGGMTLGHLPRF